MNVRDQNQQLYGRKLKHPSFIQMSIEILSDPMFEDSNLKPGLKDEMKINKSKNENKITKNT